MNKTYIKMKITNLALLLFLIMNFGLKAQNMNDIESKIDLLITKMTLEEKASLCSGRDDWSTQSIERLDIPWIWVADGPHGVRRAPATNKPGYGDQHPATCFPTASALAATWDVDLIHKVGEALGDECQALGVNVLLGPGVNIKRSVLGGRNFEYFSEDPVLAGEIGAAFINGVQSRGVGTSLKHFTANNVETRRMHANSDVDSRTLNEIYLTPFEIAVKKAQPWTIMACYNRVQEEYGTQSFELLTKILKEKWGFEGIVISDWFAVVDRVKGIEAGLHIEMPGVHKYNDKLIVETIKNGTLVENRLDELVKEILKIVFKAKSLQKEKAEFDIDAHHEFAGKVSAESITLLKNDTKTLPINKDKFQRIAVIGEFAVNPRFQGNGSSEVKPTKLDNALDLIKNEFGGSFEIEYSQGYNLKDDNDFSLIEDAKHLAANSDVVLIFAGLPLHYESEGIDRKHIDMPQSHNKLIEELSLINERTVVVLTNGSAVAMPWANRVHTILETWLGGQAGAAGVVDVLFGNVNPSGKLAETFPVRLEDTPAFLNFPGEEGNVLYGERLFVGYRYYDKKNIKPLFPFGHGLSYTTFAYSDLSVSNSQFNDKDGLEVKVKIRNSGDYKGKEVIQLYVKDIKSSLVRPEKELKKFAKVELNPKETKEVTFNLSSRDFSYYDSNREMWIAESGEFEILVGSSSRDIRLSEKVTLKSTQQIPLNYNAYTFIREYWENPDTRELLKKLIPNWIRSFVPEGKSMDEAVFNEFFIDHPVIKLPYMTNGEVDHEGVMKFVKACSSITYNP